MLLAAFLTLHCSFASAQMFDFDSNEREDGTAFFSLNVNTGQMAYMLDYGSNAGVWKFYGDAIQPSGGGSFDFAANEREDGTAFFALDGTARQLFYMLDYGSNAGVWKAYGGSVGGNSGLLRFEAIEREDGTAFFAMDAKSGQLYYMLDYGSNAGNWKAYGGTIGN